MQSPLKQSKLCYIRFWKSSKISAEPRVVDSNPGHATMGFCSIWKSMLALTRAQNDEGNHQEESCAKCNIWLYLRASDFNLI